MSQRAAILKSRQLLFFLPVTTQTKEAFPKTPIHLNKEQKRSSKHYESYADITGM